MKRLICYILAIGLSASVYAVDYPTMSSAPSAAFNSTSPFAAGGSVYTNQRQSLSGQSTRSVGSMSAISSSNFAELNSEGGACYQPSAMHVRKGRPGGGGDSGGGAIGEYDFHSPVGDALWPLLFLCILYLLRLKRREE